MLILRNKKRLLSRITAVSLFAMLSIFGIRAYNPLPNGLYACHDLSNVGIMVEDSIMTIYKYNAMFFSCNLYNDEMNIVDKCKIVPQGCGFFEISTVMPINRIFSNIKIHQSHVNFLPTDSIDCEFILSDGNFDFTGNELYVKVGHISKFCKINRDTISVRMPRGESMKFSILCGKVRAQLNGTAMGKIYAEYKPIKVFDNFIRIELTNYQSDIFLNYNIESEYIKQIAPGIFKWRGYMFVRIADTSDLKRDK